MEDEEMTLKEVVRLIRSLKAAGATEKEIYEHLENAADMPRGFILNGKEEDKK